MGAKRKSDFGAVRSVDPQADVRIPIVHRRPGDARLIILANGAFKVGLTRDLSMQIDPIISAVDVPFGAERLAADWIKVNVSGLGVSLAAVTRPAGAGPWPAVLILHGTHGFAQEYVRLATDLSRAGLLAVAACWFRGGSGEGARFISPIACPNAPPRPDPLSEDALRTVSTLVRAVRILPDVLPDALGIFGHSRGGGATLNYILRKADVQAAVLNSARYPDELRAHASELEVRS